jgi:hypothetical protein
MYFNSIRREIYPFLHVVEFVNVILKFVSLLVSPSFVHPSTSENFSDIVTEEMH